MNYVERNYRKKGRRKTQKHTEDTRYQVWNK